jgi:hypothetical protein
VNDYFFYTADSLVIRLYRFTGDAFVDFFIGTFILAFIAVIVGELTAYAVFFINRGYIEGLKTESDHYNDLTEKALKAGNKPAYQSINKLANDAFGKRFFMQAALSAAYLWPAPFILVWMDYRFSEVEFPIVFTDYSVTHVCPFVLMFITARILFKQIKLRLPIRRILSWKQ